MSETPIGSVPGVRVIERMYRRDERGWLLKVLTGFEPDLSGEVGEIYLVMALPGECRGNHFHALASEWFTVVQGEAELLLADSVTGARQVLLLSADRPVTVHVPPRIGHAFRTPPGAPSPMLLVAYSDRRYDPSDTIPMTISDA